MGSRGETVSQKATKKNHITTGLSIPYVQKQSKMILKHLSWVPKFLSQELSQKTIETELPPNLVLQNIGITMEVYKPQLCGKWTK